jgi:hypothetical protein
MKLIIKSNKNTHKKKISNVIPGIESSIGYPYVDVIYIIQEHIDIITMDN